jgi:hypothetical protein
MAAGRSPFSEVPRRQIVNPEVGLRPSRVRPRDRRGGPIDRKMGSDMVGDRYGGLDVAIFPRSATPPPPRSKAAPAARQT